jgi:hypothetical protein
VFFSLDTSAILDGWVRYYPPASFPALWDKLADLIAKGHLKATEEVLFELKKVDDDLVQWCRKQDALFVPIDEPIQIKVAEILHEHPNLVDAGKGRSGADPFVIALAELRHGAVLSSEAETGKLLKPRIPDVCRARGISCGNILYLIQQEKWTF